MSDHHVKIDRLINGYIDHSLSREEAAELETYLNESEEANARFVESVLGHFLLREHGDAVNSPDASSSNQRIVSPDMFKSTKLLSLVELISEQNRAKPFSKMSPEEAANYRFLSQNGLANDGDPSDESIEKEETHRKTTSARTLKKRKKWTFADYAFAGTVIMAIFLCIAVTIHEKNGTRSGPVELTSDVEQFYAQAVVSEIIDPVWSPLGTSLRRGQGLVDDEIMLDSGWIKLTFDSGAEAILEGPVHLKIESSMSAKCLFGKISVSVPREAQGFFIESPFGKVVDLGTQFFVEVSKKQMDVETALGLVEVSGPDKIVHRVSAGKGTTLSSLSQLTKIFNVESPRFYPMEKFLYQLNAYVAQKKSSQKDKELVLDRNPNLLARFDFTTENTNVAENLALAGRKSIPDAKIYSKKWNNGIFYDTKAVVLKEKQQYISTNIPGSWSCITLSAVAKIDYKKLEGNVLLASRNMKEPGAVLFQISERGLMKLLIQRPDGNTAHFESELVLTPALCKTWAEYTVRIDARNKTVTFLLDGKKVGSQLWPDSFPLVLGQIDIGNSLQNNNSFGNRTLGGQIAELKIFKSGK